MSEPRKSVVIVGGGSAAVAIASLLEKTISAIPGYDLIMITGKEYHYHLLGGLRANTSDADIAEKICIPYDKLFKNADISRLILKKAKDIQADKVVLEDGTEVPFAYCVVATGKEWLAPADVHASRAAAIEQMKAYRDKVKAAKKIVIIGGGAVGIEMAGEIAETYPKSSGKTVTIIHKGSKLLNDTYNDKFRNGLQKQLLDLGVNMHLGDSLDKDYDFTTGPLDLKTVEGHTINGVDLVITATGGSVNTYVLQNLVPNSISRAGVKVRPTLQLEGHDNIFVIGDLADLPEQKQAAKVPGHAALVNSNISALINGKPLANYKKQPEIAVITIGKTGGLGYLQLPLLGPTVMGAWFARMIKGKGLFIQPVRASLGEK